MFRIKGPQRNCPRCGSTMTAMMIDDGKRVAAGGARLQWHMIPIADIDLIATKYRGKENGVTFATLLSERTDFPYARRQCWRITALLLRMFLASASGVLAGEPATRRRETQPRSWLGPHPRAR